MLDPFFTPPASLAKLTEPLAAATNLTTLPLHSHEILLSFVFYHFIDSFVSPRVSSWLFPKTYPAFNRRTARNWNMHFTSLVQSCIICALALYMIFRDEERRTMTWQERIWGYTGATGMVQAFACGYFLWDVQISLVDLSIFGTSSLIHAISALLVTSMGFRPFANYYGLSFVLYELSTPLLNFHWFFDKLNMTGSKPQFYNGIALLAIFFLCRVVWGNYQSYWIYKDIWQAYHTQGVLGASPLLEKADPMVATEGSVNSIAEVMRFAGDQTVPDWLAISYMASNTMLSLLNVYWFWQMIAAVRKRFQPPKQRKLQSAGTEQSAPDKKVL